jgi:hypothetical protein
MPASMQSTEFNKKNFMKPSKKRGPFPCSLPPVSWPTLEPHRPTQPPSFPFVCLPPALSNVLWKRFHPPQSGLQLRIVGRRRLALERPVFSLGHARLALTPHGVVWGQPVLRRGPLLELFRYPGSSFFSLSAASTHAE